MLKFVKWAFRSFFGVLLWFNLIGHVVIVGALGYAVTVIPTPGGARLGSMLGDGIVWHIVGAVVGVIIGALIGAITNILFGGLIATFLDIGSDVTSLKADVADIKGSAAATAAVFQKMANRNASGGGM
jgi:hypothetical protein